MARFTEIDSNVSVQYWLELTGDNSLKLQDIDWPEKHFEPQSETRLDKNGGQLPPTLRLYAKGERTSAGVMFTLPPVNEFDFAGLQFQRVGSRIAAARPVLDEEAELTGFSRPNPYTGKKCHQDYSEPYVDRRPGTVYTNRQKETATWKAFEPVWLKVKPKGQDPYYLLARTVWVENTVFVSIVRDPKSGAPTKLSEYSFPEREVVPAAPMAKALDILAAASHRRPRKNP